MSTIPKPNWYFATQVFFTWYFDLFYEYTLSGAEGIPSDGPIIFAANHLSFYDPPAIGAKIERKINYFARDSLFKGRFGQALEAIGTIPVARENADVKSLKAIFKSLKAGGAVAIYPEGTRSFDGQLGQPQAGAGMIACKSGATVIPTRLFGTYEAYNRHQSLPKLSGSIHIAYGAPVSAQDLDPGKSHPERYLEVSRQIMQRIAALQMPQNPIV